MDLTLYALAKVRTLYEAGASVEEVYETLSERSQTATDSTERAPISERRAGHESALTATAARAAYLARLVERPQQQPSIKAAPEVPPTETASEPSEMAVNRTEPEPVTGAAPTPSSPAPRASAADEHPRAPVTDEASIDPSPVPDLRDRIAVAVTRINMLKGDGERCRDGSGSSVREG